MTASVQGPERLAALLALADEIVEDYYDYIDNGGERARELVRKYRALRYFVSLPDSGDAPRVAQMDAARPVTSDRGFDSSKDPTSSPRVTSNGESASRLGGVEALMQAKVAPALDAAAEYFPASVLAKEARDWAHVLEYQQGKPGVDYGLSAETFSSLLRKLANALERAALGSAPPVRAEPIDVVAAVRRDSTGRYWLCRRNSDGAHGGLAGMWEYPGGRVELGEQLRDALVRELQEEFGIQRPLVGAVLDSIEYQGYRVTFFEVVMQEPVELYKHTEARWMTAEEARRVEHLPSGTIFNARHLASAPDGLRAALERANNVVACVACKRPVYVSALNAIRCEQCKEPSAPRALRGTPEDP